MSKHTELPWKVNHNLDISGMHVTGQDGEEWYYWKRVIFSHNGTAVGEVSANIGAVGGFPRPKSGGEVIANMELVVTAVNHHQKLLDALQDATHTILILLNDSTEANEVMEDELANLTALLREVNANKKGV